MQRFVPKPFIDQVQQRRPHPASRPYAFYVPHVPQCGILSAAWSEAAFNPYSSRTSFAARHVSRSIMNTEKSVSLQIDFPSAFYRNPNFLATLGTRLTISSAVEPSFSICLRTSETAMFLRDASFTTVMSFR